MSAPVEFSKLINEADHILQANGSSLRYEETLESHRGYIYFLQDSYHSDVIKIGFTKNHKSRLKAYRVVLPDPKFIAIAPGNRQFERSLHEWLTRGPVNVHVFREYFKIKKEEIQGICNSLFCEHGGNFPVIFL